MLLAQGWQKFYLGSALGGSALVWEAKEKVEDGSLGVAERFRFLIRDVLARVAGGVVGLRLCVAE